MSRVVEECRRCRTTMARKRFAQKVERYNTQVKITRKLPQTGLKAQDSHQVDSIRMPVHTACSPVA